MKKICRIITDEKAGNINPAFALGEMIAQQLNLEIEHIKVKRNIFIKLCPVFLYRFLGIYRLICMIYKIYNHDQIVMTIGNGSASIGICAALSMDNRLRHHKKIIFAQLQNPRIHPEYFDYVIAPLHDHVRGVNSIPTIGSLSRVNYILQTQDIPKTAAFKALPQPIVAVFIGGQNSRYQFSNKEATELAQYLLNYSITQKTSLVITCSRRTGEKNEAILRKMLNKSAIYFPEQSQNENPYYMMLKYAKAAIVTCDSVNMISDCVVAGLQTFLYNLPGQDGKFAYFYNALKRRELLFDAHHDQLCLQKPFRALNETKRVARIMIAAINNNTTINGGSTHG